MTAAHAVVGLALGALGAAAYLAITRWRAALALTRGPGLSLAAFPLALFGPAAAIVLAARIAPAAAWSAALGLVVTRWLLLRRFRDARGLESNAR